MTEVRHRTVSLDHVQLRVMLVLVDGPITIENVAWRAGVGAFASSPRPSRQISAWWRSIVKRMPPGLITSTWHLPKHQLLWSLTGLGSDVLRETIRSELSNAA
ncbi:hypothetical protein [Roseococcus sp.]|uniref:hypothetical protein n=1 Tax=Roseococcus sp. TaxID=2109646 RepID=UPI003BAD9C66